MADRDRERVGGVVGPRQLVERYRTAGYAFVVFTDHGRVTACNDLNDGAFLALPGPVHCISCRHSLCVGRHVPPPMVPTTNDGSVTVV